MSNQRKKIIQNYLDGYNNFDIDKMTIDFSDEIVFQNMQNGKVNMTLYGIAEFKQQAEQTKSYFESREQKMTFISHSDDKTEIEIEYSAVLAIDFSNGLKKGEKIVLKGISIFMFKDNKIMQITDIS
ncbi:MAG: nuclear transport factor 2 family protein [Bacteroidetes Order II. Incertae sedis bacterium]|nr:nuclear transport factor 2 family protein [Bacteroidetes Order II. bacterium]